LSSMSPHQKYPELVRASLERYLAHLAIKSPSLGTEGRVAVGRLVETIEAAIHHSAELEPDQIRFGVTSLMTVGADLPAFVNQYSLGVGCDACGGHISIGGQATRSRVACPIGFRRRCFLRACTPGFGCSSIWLM
jgi:hypothetical protein